MTQAVPEVKNPNQTQPETIETNGNGVPSTGHDENISNEAAVAETITDIETETGTVDAATQELETDPNIVKVEPFAPKPDIHPEVAAAGVTAVDPHAEAEEMNKVAQNLGGQIVGSEIPTSNLGQAVGEFNPPKPAHDPTDTNVFPPVLKSSEYANPENNGLPLHRLAIKRIGELLFGKGKLVAGVQEPNNISQFPAQPQQQEVKKAA